jgi:voltage-gated potassium channel
LKPGRSRPRASRDGISPTWGDVHTTALEFHERGMPTDTKRESATPRAVRRLTAKPLTAKRAARLIAEFTLALTLGAGTLAWLLDRDDFPTLGTGLWWALQTVTTVGYGDVTPTHTEGRVIATVVILAGIGFLAVITAAITASFVEKARERMTGSADDEIARQLKQISARLAALEANQNKGEGHASR